MTFFVMLFLLSPAEAFFEPMDFSHFDYKVINSPATSTGEKENEVPFQTASSTLWNRILWRCFQDHYNLKFFKSQVNCYLHKTAIFSDSLPWAARVPCIDCTIVKPKSRNKKKKKRDTFCSTIVSMFIFRTV